MNGSGCCCQNPWQSESIPEMTVLSTEQAATASASGHVTCVADGLCLAASVPGMLEPVAIGKDCNQIVITVLTISYTASLNVTFYLLGSNDPTGNFTAVASGNISALGYTAFSLSTAFGYCYWRLVGVSGAGVVTFGTIYGCCSAG